MRTGSVMFKKNCGDATHCGVGEPKEGVWVLDEPDVNYDIGAEFVLKPKASETQASEPQASEPQDLGLDDAKLCESNVRGDDDLVCDIAIRTPSPPPFSRESSVDGAVPRRRTSLRAALPNARPR